MDTRKQHCDVCGTVTKTLRNCTGCYCKHYCSRSCQRTDWKVHRQYCKNMKQGTDSVSISQNNGDTDKSTLKRGLQYQRYLPYLTEVQWDIFDLVSYDLFEIRIIIIK